MRTLLPLFACGLTAFTLVGCSIAERAPTTRFLPTVSKMQSPTIAQASHVSEDKSESLPPPKILPPLPVDDEAESVGIGLPELTQLTLQRNPRLAQLDWAIESARGRALQAGLYPNPTVSVTGNELGDRTGPSGIWSVYTGQEIVSANKLGLTQAAARKQVDQAALNLIAERFRVLTEVRQAFFEAVTLQRRVDILRELVQLAKKSTENAEKLLKAKEAAELDVVQLDVDLERYRAELESTERALPGAYRKLAARIGLQDMQLGRVLGDLNTPLPDYDLDRLRLYVLGIHPEVRAAQIGVERAQLVLRRAEVEPIPNVTVGAGYTRQGQNRSDDWDIGVSIPIPVWNKNQGSILAAKAQISEAVNEVGRVRNDLVNRLATSFATYASARRRAERYTSAILPRAQRTLELSRKAYQGGQFEYLRVLEAQRAVGEANLELVRSLGEMWQAASEIAGLMLEDQWPLAPAAAPPGRNEP